MEALAFALLLFLVVAAAAPATVLGGASPFHLFTTQSAAAKLAFSGDSGKSNPFTPKAAAIRYWDRKVPAGNSHPDFIVSKLSPLSALEETTYASLAAADPKLLTPRLSAFCAAAGLLCSPAVSASLESRDKDSNFVSYQNINYTNYGSAATGGMDSFKNYSDGENVPVDSFRRYSRASTGHNDSFAFYSPDGNVVTSNFTSYATGATGGAGEFISYSHLSNAPADTFTNYDAQQNGRSQLFSSYSDDTNAGNQEFSGYGRGGNGGSLAFASYANNSNVIGSDFANYAKDGNAANDSFTSYGFNGNVPENTFRSYGDGGNAGADSFASYRDQSNVGDDTFLSYEKGGNAAAVGFTNYGNSFNEGSDRFKGYGEGANDPHIQFATYAGDNTSFASYAKAGVTFTDYKNASVVPAGMKAEGKGIKIAPAGEKRESRWAVEPGKFFRERDLKEGNVMPMPDIRDKLPPRAFLPRAIAGNLPFAATEVATIFNTEADTALGRAIHSTVGECERAPSKGETKRCPTSAEEMVDFAVLVLGPTAVARSTATAAGSGGDVAVGKVTPINGGNVTQSVSCHQSLFPYLVYYCHSVPKVRVYEADILAVESQRKINHGVAICHLDTSDWSATHGAFLALGSAPGRIEVCHWIFQGDLTWAAAD